jgi:hypothetical protein
MQRQQVVDAELEEEQAPFDGAERALDLQRMNFRRAS